MKKDIGERIKKIRQSMNLTKEQFAKLIGISGQYLGVVESGVHGLSVDSIIILCKKTHISADYILFGKENISNEKLKDLFVGVNEDQIDIAFSTLKNIALLIKASDFNEEEKEI